MTGNVLTDSGEPASGSTRQRQPDRRQSMDGNVGHLLLRRSQPDRRQRRHAHASAATTACGAAIDGSGGADNLVERNRITGTRREGIRLTRVRGRRRPAGDRECHPQKHRARRRHGRDRAPEPHRTRSAATAPSRTISSRQPRDRLGPRRHQRRPAREHRLRQRRAAQPRAWHRGGARASSTAAATSRSATAIRASA